MSTATDLAALSRQARITKAAADLKGVQDILATLSTRAQAAARNGKASIEISIERDPAIFNAVMTPKGVEFLTSAAQGFVVRPDQSGNLVRIYWEDPAAEFTPTV